MSKSIVAKHVADVKTAEKWSEVQRREWLENWYEITADSLHEAALVVKAAYEAKDDLSWLPRQAVARFLRIADGQLQPEIYQKCIGTPLENHIHKFPVSVQHKLCDEPVKLYKFENGNTDHRLITIPDMTHDEFKQVFDVRSGSVRTAAQQRSYIEEKEAKPVKVRNENEWDIVKDRRNKRIIITVDKTEVILTAKQIIALLGEIS